jgi:hypothetical protein
MGSLAEKRQYGENPQRQELREMKTREYSWIMVNKTLETSITALTSEALLARADESSCMRKQLQQINDENIKLNQELDHKESRVGEEEMCQRMTRSLTFHQHISYWLSEQYGG